MKHIIGYSLIIIAAILGWVFFFLKNDDDKIQKVEEKVIILEDEIKQLEADRAALLEQDFDLQPEGVFFEVQVGAFKEFDLSEYSAHFARLKQLDLEGLNKYVLGRFANYETAKKFLRDIRRMGLEDAFMVGMIDGAYATEEEAVEMVQNK